MTRKKLMPAAELQRLMDQDPASVTLREQREKQLSVWRPEYDRHEKPILDALASVGVKVASVWDLRGRYDAAIPVLLKHLQLPYPPRIRASLARALARPWARWEAWDHVLAAYIAEPNHPQSEPQGLLGGPHEFKDGLAVAVSALASPNTLSTIIELISDRRHGRSRIFFVSNLTRSRTLAAAEALHRLASDPELKTEIAHVMKQKALRETRIRGKRKMEPRD